MNLAKYLNKDKDSSEIQQSEFNELKPRLKSPKNRFQLSAGLNFETTIFEPKLKFFKFGLR